MRILGIDPGLATIGFGIIDTTNHRLSALSYGAITTPAHTSLGDRLCTIHDHLSDLIQQYTPDSCGMESVFFSKNVKTAMLVGHARGVLLQCLTNHHIPVFDYSPTAIKQGILGYGGATKHQVQFMTTELLQLPQVPKPDDVADALAIAICHHHSISIQSRV